MVLLADKLELILFTLIYRCKRTTDTLIVDGTDDKSAQVPRELVRCVNS